MSPAEAIAAATSVAAGCCNVPDTGTLRPGMRADLIAVDGNPLDDVGILQHADRIMFVMPDGGVYKNRVA